MPRFSLFHAQRDPTDDPVDFGRLSGDELVDFSGQIAKATALSFCGNQAQAQFIRDEDHPGRGGPNDGEELIRQLQDGLIPPPLPYQVAEPEGHAVYNDDSVRGAVLLEPSDHVDGNVGGDPASVA